LHYPWLTEADRVRILLLLVALIAIAGCGGESTTPTTLVATTVPAVTTSPAVAAPTTRAPATTVPSTATVSPTTATTTTTTTTTLPPSVCPTPVPLQESTLRFAPVGGDFDGDGNPDELFTYQADPDEWRVRIVFADGGGADAAIVESEDLAPPRPIGGFDIDGDGAEEVFLVVGSGASAAEIGFYDVADCVATRITVGGVPAVFAIGSSVGAVAGVSCPGDGTIQRNFAQYVAENEYEGGFAPYRLDGPVLTELPGDGAGFTAEEAFALGVLDCGELVLP
jgi:hypothetical protein